MSDAHLGTWVLIVPYMLVFGIARGIWENTNKSVIADFFGMVICIYIFLLGACMTPTLSYWVLVLYSPGEIVVMY